MHMCDYCCWYYAPSDCECPWVMKESACEKARKKKEQADKVLNKNIHESKRINRTAQAEHQISW